MSATYIHLDAQDHLELSSMCVIVLAESISHYGLSKMWCAHHHCHGEHDVCDDMWSIFGQISTLFGIYISHYIILLIIAKDEYDTYGDTSLFRDFIYISCHIILLIVANDDEHDVCVVTCCSVSPQPWTDIYCIQTGPLTLNNDIVVH